MFKKRFQIEKQNDKTSAFGYFLGSRFLNERANTDFSYLELLDMDKFEVVASASVAGWSQKLLFVGKEIAVGLTDAIHFYHNDDLSLNFVRHDLKLSGVTQTGLTNHIKVQVLDVNERHNAVFSVRDEEVIWVSTEYDKLGGVGIYDGYALGSASGKVTRVDLLTGELLWAVDIPNHLQNVTHKDCSIPEFMGVSQGVLVIGFTKIFRLFGIDIETGEVLWDREKIVQYCQINSGRLISFGGGGYSDMDLRTGEKLDSFSDRDYFESHKFMCGRGDNILLGDHIIDTGSGGTIGAFNTKTHKIDWLYTDPDAKSFPTASGFPMHYADGYLMLKDDEQTLHIYQKQ